MKVVLKLSYHYMSYISYISLGIPICDDDSARSFGSESCILEDTETNPVGGSISSEGEFSYCAGLSREISLITFIVDVSVPEVLSFLELDLYLFISIAITIKVECDEIVLVDIFARVSHVFVVL